MAFTHLTQPTACGAPWEARAPGSQPAQVGTGFSAQSQVTCLCECLAQLLATDPM